MNREDVFKNNPDLLALFHQVQALYKQLESAFQEKYNRSLPSNELLNDRWERAQKLGFGSGTNIYDSSLVFGQPLVGKNCWIGPYTIIDGSGGLEIGNHCTISVGVHLYSHDNLMATLKPESFEIEKSPVKIGNNCYIAPHSIVTRGVTLGNYCVVAANSMVNRSFSDFSILGGNPAKKIGSIQFIDDDIKFNYD